MKLSDAPFFRPTVLFYQPLPFYGENINALFWGNFEITPLKTSPTPLKSRGFKYVYMFIPGVGRGGNLANIGF